MPPTPDAARPGPGVPDRGREDSCPGALRLHMADDGALARIRVPGGLLTVRQALVLADAASELGDGSLETTSRGNVQLRGLPSDSGLELGRRLRAAGLLPSDSHERVRNIVASPSAGLDGAGYADVQSWTRELDAALCAADRAAGLSGKFLFALDDGRGDVAALDADVTLIATPDGGSLLRFGRATTARRVPAGEAARYALAGALEFLDALRDTGTAAWHLRDVPTLLAPGAELDPGAEPLPVLDGGAPQVGELPGGLCVGLRFGRVSAAQWRLLAEVADGELRVTPWRTVVLPRAARDRLAELAHAGLRTDPGSPWERATACTGTPGCAKSLADVRADAARALSGAVGGGLLPVHWSGCERRCGHPAGEWVDVLATGQGYRVTARPGGTPTSRTSQDLTTEEMAEAVAEARRIK
ncbi:cobalamin biosynthesis protein CobG [Kitasatospora sp. MAP5-34]|uniref:cobalamin biosynthesis protein CobG n=1 Tax=Kitasatospora sp. MAP5-34 TaxID=3035102 RepID=UPI0024750219|nr:cobalamin biosynthesis protein CobG [Kitasatospora sp. MAP5-34]